MSDNPAQRRARLIEKATEAVDRILAWEAEHPEARLRDMEAELERVRHEVSQIWLGDLVAERERRVTAGSITCPACGERMQSKGAKVKRVETLVGAVHDERQYYYCPRCQRGLFPPG